MKILLIGNYPYLYSQSMDRFAAVLKKGLVAAGHEVRLLKPSPLIGRIRPSATGLGKWLGYLDRLLLFRHLLDRASGWADIIHICDHANAVYVPWLKGKPHVVTCHDMLAIRSALGEINGHRTGPSGRIYQRWILSGLKKAQHIACVSVTTRDDVLTLASLDPRRVSVVRNGLNYNYRPMSEMKYLEHLHQMGLGDIRPFFLHVGNNNWYKNKAGLLQIFGQMARLTGDSQVSLVLVGSGLSKSLHVLGHALGIQNQIREVGVVSNEQLRALYSAANGLIFPSLAEGFGWPIIEAQACGCLVFASNRKPMTEVGGEGSVYFDPIDKAGAAQIILQMIHNKDLLSERGYRNAMNYSTGAMIDSYRRLYHLAVT